MCEGDWCYCQTTDSTVLAAAIAVLDVRPATRGTNILATGAPIRYALPTCWLTGPSSSDVGFSLYRWSQHLQLPHATGAGRTHGRSISTNVNLLGFGLTSGEFPGSSHAFDRFGDVGSCPKWASPSPWMPRPSPDWNDFPIWYVGRGRNRFRSTLTTINVNEADGSANVLSMIRQLPFGVTLTSGPCRRRPVTAVSRTFHGFLGQRTGFTPQDLLFNLDR